LSAALSTEKVTESLPLALAELTILAKVSLSTEAVALSVEIFKLAPTEARDSRVEVGRVKEVLGTLPLSVELLPFSKIKDN
jgi:hypothetical protein